MDTWATSSVTPQIVSGYETDPDLFDRTFPMDLRPQAHDIIRTWLFSSVVRGHFEHGVVPWHHAALSGWILDPDRKKMSKSKGNVVTPMALLEEYGSDGVRYWAARGGPGVDTAFDAGQMKVGRRLAIKLLNASKFALASGPATGEVTEALDRGMLTDLAALVGDATAALDEYEYARAVDRTEAFFWSFCDNYLELVKSRRYGDHGQAGADSANRAMQAALSVMLRLFAPFLPFVTEEVWSWWQEGSIHRAPWPAASDLSAIATPDEDASRTLAVAVDVLGEIRRARSEAKRPTKTVISRAVVRDTAERLARLEQARADLCASGSVRSLTLDPAAAFSVEIEFAEPESPVTEPAA
jgi:valyl-tRNA synthetase